MVNHVHELEQLYEKIDIDLQHSGIEYVKLAIPDFEEGMAPWDSEAAEIIMK